MATEADTQESTTVKNNEDTEAYLTSGQIDGAVVKGSHEGPPEITEHLVEPHKVKEIADEMNTANGRNGLTFSGESFKDSVDAAKVANGENATVLESCQEKEMLFQAADTKSDEIERVQKEQKPQHEEDSGNEEYRYLERAKQEVVQNVSVEENPQALEKETNNLQENIKVGQTTNENPDVMSDEQDSSRIKATSAHNEEALIHIPEDSHQPSNLRGKETCTEATKPTETVEDEREKLLDDVTVENAITGAPGSQGSKNQEGATIEVGESEKLELLKPSFKLAAEEETEHTTIEKNEEVSQGSEVIENDENKEKQITQEHDSATDEAMSIKEEIVRHSEKIVKAGTSKQICEELETSNIDKDKGHVEENTPKDSSVMLRQIEDETLTKEINQDNIVNHSLVSEMPGEDPQKVTQTKEETMPDVSESVYTEIAKEGEVLKGAETENKNNVETSCLAFKEEGQAAKTTEGNEIATANTKLKSEEASNFGGSQEEEPSEVLDDAKQKVASEAHDYVLSSQAEDPKVETTSKNLSKEYVTEPLEDEDIPPSKLSETENETAEKIQNPCASVEAETEKENHLESNENQIEDNQNSVEDKVDKKKTEEEQSKMEVEEKVEKEQTESETIKTVIFSEEVHAGIHKADNTESIKEQVTEKENHKNEPNSEVITPGSVSVQTQESDDNANQGVGSRVEVEVKTEKEQTENDTIKTIIVPEEVHEETNKADDIESIKEKVTEKEDLINEPNDEVKSSSPVSVQTRELKDSASQDAKIVGESSSEIGQLVKEENPKAEDTDSNLESQLPTDDQKCQEREKLKDGNPYVDEAEVTNTASEVINPSKTQDAEKAVGINDHKHAKEGTMSIEDPGAEQLERNKSTLVAPNELGDHETGETAEARRSSTVEVAVGVQAVNMDETAHHETSPAVESVDHIENPSSELPSDELQPKTIKTVVEMEEEPKQAEMVKYESKEESPAKPEDEIGSQQEPLVALEEKLQEEKGTADRTLQLEELCLENEQIEETHGQKEQTKELEASSKEVTAEKQTQTEETSNEPIQTTPVFPSEQKHMTSTEVEKIQDEKPKEAEIPAYESHEEGSTRKTNGDTCSQQEKVRELVETSQEEGSITDQTLPLEKPCLENEQKEEIHLQKDQTKEVETYSEANATEMQTIRGETSHEPVQIPPALPSEQKQITSNKVEKTQEEKQKEADMQKCESQEEAPAAKTEEEICSQQEKSRELDQTLQEEKNAKDQALLLEESHLENKQKKQTHFEKEQTDELEAPNEEITAEQQTPTEETSNEPIQIPSALPSEQEQVASIEVEKDEKPKEAEMLKHENQGEAPAAKAKDEIILQQEEGKELEETFQQEKNAADQTLPLEESCLQNKQIEVHLEKEQIKELEACNEEIPADQQTLTEEMSNEPIQIPSTSHTEEQEQSTLTEVDKTQDENPREAQLAEAERHEGSTITTATEMHADQNLSEVAPEQIQTPSSISASDNLNQRTSVEVRKEREGEKKVGAMEEDEGHKSSKGKKAAQTPADHALPKETLHDHTPYSALVSEEEKKAIPSDIMTIQEGEVENRESGEHETQKGQNAAKITEKIYTQEDQPRDLEVSETDKNAAEQTPMQEQLQVHSSELHSDEVELTTSGTAVTLEDKPQEDEQKTRELEAFRSESFTTDQILSLEESPFANEKKEESIVQNEQTREIEAPDEQIQTPSSAQPSDEQEHVTSTEVQETIVKESKLAKDETQEGSDSAKITEVLADQNLQEEVTADVQIQTPSPVLSSGIQVQETPAEVEKLQKEETKEAEVAEAETQEDHNASKAAENICPEPRDLEASKEDRKTADQTPIAEESQEQLQTLSSGSCSDEHKQTLEKVNLLGNVNQEESSVAKGIEEVQSEKQEPGDLIAFNEDKSTNITEVKSEEMLVEESQDDASAKKSEEACSSKEDIKEPEEAKEITEHGVDNSLAVPETETEEEVKIASSVIQSEENKTGSTASASEKEEERREEAKIEKESTPLDSSAANKESKKGLEISGSMQDSPADEQEKVRSLGSALVPETKETEKEINHAVSTENQMIPQPVGQIEEAWEPEVDQRLPEEKPVENIQNQRSVLSEKKLVDETPTEINKIQEKYKEEAEAAEDEKQEVANTSNTPENISSQEEEPKDLEAPNKDEGTSSQPIVVENLQEQLQILSSTSPSQEQEEKMKETELPRNVNQDVSTTIAAEKLQEQLQTSSPTLPSQEQEKKTKETGLPENVIQEDSPTTMANEKTSAEKVELRNLKAAEKEEPIQTSTDEKIDEEKPKEVKVIEDESQQDSFASRATETICLQKEKEPKELEERSPEIKEDETKDEGRIENDNPEILPATKKTEEACSTKEEIRKKEDVADHGVAPSLTLPEEKNKHDTTYTAMEIIEEKTDVANEIIQNKLASEEVKDDKEVQEIFPPNSLAEETRKKIHQEDKLKATSEAVTTPTHEGEKLTAENKEISVDNITEKPQGEASEMAQEIQQQETNVPVTLDKEIPTEACDTKSTDTMAMTGAEDAPPVQQERTVEASEKDDKDEEPCDAEGLSSEVKEGEHEEDKIPTEINKIQAKETKEVEVEKDKMQEVANVSNTTEDICSQDEEPKDLEASNVVAEKSQEQLQTLSSILPSQEQEQESEEPGVLEASKKDEGTSDQTIAAEKPQEQLQTLRSTLPSQEQEEKTEEIELPKNVNQEDSPSTTAIEKTYTEKQELRNLEVAEKEEPRQNSTDGKKEEEKRKEVKMVEDESQQDSFASSATETISLQKQEGPKELERGSSEIKDGKKDEESLEVEILDSASASKKMEEACMPMEEMRDIEDVTDHEVAPSLTLPEEKTEHETTATAREIVVEKMEEANEIIQTTVASEEMKDKREVQETFQPNSLQEDELKAISETIIIPTHKKEKLSREKEEISVDKVIETPQKEVGKIAQEIHQQEETIPATLGKEIPAEAGHTESTETTTLVASEDAPAVQQERTVEASKKDDKDEEPSHVKGLTSEVKGEDRVDKTVYKSGEQKAEERKLGDSAKDAPPVQQERTVEALKKDDEEEDPSNAKGLRSEVTEHEHEADKIMNDLGEETAKELKVRNIGEDAPPVQQERSIEAKTKEEEDEEPSDVKGLSSELKEKEHGVEKTMDCSEEQTAKGLKLGDSAEDALPVQQEMSMEVTKKEEPSDVKCLLSEVEQQEHGAEKITDDLGEQTANEPKSEDSSRASLSDLLTEVKKDIPQAAKHEKEGKSTVAEKEGAETEEKSSAKMEERAITLVEEAKLEEEKHEEDEVDEHKEEKPEPDATVTAEDKDTNNKTGHKKSHNILSGVGSKVKHSLSKVKKAITGKSSHTKPVSPK